MFKIQHIRRTLTNANNEPRVKGLQLWQPLLGVFKSGVRLDAMPEFVIASKASERASSCALEISNREQSTYEHCAVNIPSFGAELDTLQVDGLGLHDG